MKSFFATVVVLFKKNFLRDKITLKNHIKSNYNYAGLPHGR